MDYNQRKWVVLSAVYAFGEATVYEVWEAMDDEVSYYAIGMSLLRYHRQGLLNRRGNKAKTYKITEKGVERLNWFKSLADKYKKNENEEKTNEEAEDVEGDARIIEDLHHWAFSNDKFKAIMGDKEEEANEPL